MEIEEKGVQRIVVLCVYQASDGLKVKTRSDKIARIRKKIIELLLTHALVPPVLTELVKEYNADKDRFAPKASFCIHCGLCVRYCNEVKNKGAIGFTGRGTSREISFIPQIALKECRGCKECFPLCPTSYLQATYQLVQALAFPSK